MRVEESDFEDRLQDYHVFDFGTFYFFDNIIVSEINEGVTFSYNDAKRFINMALEYYGKEKNIIYISNRVNSYSVKPTDWVRINNDLKNLMAIGVVHYSEFAKNTYKIEKMFCKRPFKGFWDLKDAFVWAKHLAKKNNPVAIPKPNQEND